MEAFRAVCNPSPYASVLHGLVGEFMWPLRSPGATLDGEYFAQTGELTMKMTEEDVARIERVIDEYDRSRRLRISEAYGDGGSGGMLGPRLKRAAVDQACGDGAAPSRYGIWANTVRDTVIDALGRVRKGAPQGEIAPLLIAAANSLSAFAEIQRIFDDQASRPTDDET